MEYNGMMATTHPRPYRQRRRRRPSDRDTLLVMVATLLSVVVIPVCCLDFATGLSASMSTTTTRRSSRSPPSTIFSAGGGLKQERVGPRTIRAAALSSSSLSARTVRGGSATMGRSSSSRVAAAAAAMMAVVGHLVPVSLVAAFLPTCLGFWRTGYTVSYGYGGAMVLSGLTHLVRFVEQHPRSHSAVSSASAGVPLVAAVHAALYVCYGLRLCLFLVQRELQTPVEIHGMLRRNDPVKVRFTKRFPIIIGSSVLYWCMSTAPMHVIYHTTTTTLVSATTQTHFLEYLVLGVGFSGFLFAAIGDAWKAVMKSRNGADTLVTTGPFRYFRHPNYTGEMLGWTCLCLLLPVLTTLQAAASTATASWTSMLSAVGPYLLASVLGWAGMVLGVLMVEATAGLEQKQYDKYGTTKEYQHWITKSWAGPMFKKKTKKSVATTKDEKKEL